MVCEGRLGWWDSCKAGSSLKRWFPRRPADLWCFPSQKKWRCFRNLHHLVDGSDLLFCHIVFCFFGLSHFDCHVFGEEPIHWTFASGFIYYTRLCIFVLQLTHINQPIIRQCIASFGRQDLQKDGMNSSSRSWTVWRTIISFWATAVNSQEEADMTSEEKLWTFFYDQFGEQFIGSGNWPCMCLIWCLATNVHGRRVMWDST